MIQAKDLRIGNWVIHNSEWSHRNDGKMMKRPFPFQWEDSDWYAMAEGCLALEQISPIPLTPEILQKCGFYQLPHFTVHNGFNINIGRKRVISVGCVGTPNEMVFISEEQPPEVKNLIVARNFDYDGKTYLHQLQNLYYALTQTELQIQL